MSLFLQGYWLGVSYLSDLPCLMQLLTLNLSDYHVFGAVKNNIWKINSLPIKYGCSYQNVLQNNVNSLSKMVLKTWVFVQNLKILYTFLTIRMIWCGSNFASMWSKYVLSNNFQRDFRIPVSAFATLARRSFNGKLTAKLVFRSGHFMLPLLTPTLAV